MFFSSGSLLQIVCSPWLKWKKLGQQSVGMLSVFKMMSLLISGTSCRRPKVPEGKRFKKRRPYQTHRCMSSLMANYASNYSECVCVSWLCRAAFIVGSPDLMITLCPAALMTWEQRPKRWRQSTCWYESMSLLSWGRDQVQRRYDIWQIRQKVLNWPTFLCFTHIEAQPHPKTPTNKHWPSPTKCRGKMLVASAYCQKLPNISKNYQELQKDAKGAKSYQEWTKRCKKCQSHMPYAIWQKM